ncbi:MAG TPA: DUF5985 family protein [Pseudolabrys sp.]|jgi:hypothetical protein|nr:DUF5985 family protein [Pseudolabrys sp.]
MSNPIATVVYLLCFATSAGCGGLLVRSYFRTRAALLLWTAACFVLLGINSFLVVVDLVLLPNIDLQYFRLATTLTAVATLLYGFIWEID